LVNGKQQRLPHGFKLFDAGVILASTQTPGEGELGDSGNLFDK
jgi:hypothetical protein